MQESSHAIEFTRIFLGIYFTIVAIFYTLRIVLTKKKLKIELVYPGSRFCSTWWNHMIFRFLRMSIWLICLFRIPFPSIDSAIGSIDIIMTDPVIITGVVCLILSFSYIASINMYLSNKWRSGIDPGQSADLWTMGLYRYSRNPMFLGVYLGQLGFFLALPSVFSLVCWIIGFMAVYRQTLAEESHLGERFNDEYIKYQQQVSRWLSPKNLFKLIVKSPH